MIEEYWTVLTLNIPDILSDWLLSNAKDIIDRFHEFFQILMAKGDLTKELAKSLSSLLDEVKEACLKETSEEN